MRVLVACRLMSGFAESVRTGRWQPSGSPAIYRLFDALIGRGDDLSLIFTAKEAGRDFSGAWPDRRDCTLSIEGLDAPVTLLTGAARIPRLFGRWRGHLSDLRQTWRIWRAVRAARPDLLYVDRANILAGALVARFTSTRVVLRVLGVTPAMKQMAVGTAPTHRLDRWCYRSPFTLVIGTDEGSGTRHWLGRMLRSDVPREARVNGVDPATAAIGPDAALDDGRLHVALVGRLDALKRCDEAVEGVIAMTPEKRRRVVLHIVGNGDRLAALQQRVAEGGANDSIVFHGAVPHAEVAGILARCDLYVSFNRQGNLSNANLEALAAGLAFILPEPDPDNGTDLDTDRVIPTDAGIRLPADNLPAALRETLETLVDGPDSIAALRAGAQRAATRLATWQERMCWEADRLSALADTRPADIAIVIADLAAGGAQRVALGLAESWTNAGRRVDLVTFAGSDTDFFHPGSAIRRRIVGASGNSAGIVSAVLANLRRIRRLRRALRASGAPVIVSFIAPTNVLTVLAARGLGARVVISERNDPARQSFGPLWDWLRRTVYPRADMVTANSEGALASLGAWVSDDKLALVPNPVAPAPVAPGRDTSNRILAVGRLHPQKGFDILLDAFAGLAGDRPEWRLDMLGDGPLRETLAGQAERLGFGDRIAWHGTVSDTGRYYRDAAIFALPSRHEGMPNALLEAMAHGLAVIVSDASPGPLEIVEDGVNGRVVPVGDAAALARTIDELIGAPDLRRRLGDAARTRVAAMTPERVLAAWDAALGLAGADGCAAQSGSR